jgi:hypothetical protein
MKLDLCLVSCDLNPNYYPYFPLVKQCWKTIVGIDCLLILVGKEIPYELYNERESIILFPPIEDIPTAFQAQCIRLLYSSLLAKKYSGIIISDMDIIPLNREYFVNSIEKLPEDTFCVYRDVISEYRQYPMCYCAGSSAVWSVLFPVRIMNDLRECLRSWYNKDDYAISSPYSEMWAQDQTQLFIAVNKNWNRIKSILMRDEVTRFQRLDRMDINFIYDNIDEIKKRITNGEYSDFHLPRPYNMHKLLLDELLSEVLCLFTLQEVRLEKYQDPSCAVSGQA